MTEPDDLDAAIRLRIQTIGSNATRRAIEAGQRHDKPVSRLAVDTEAVCAALMAAVELHKPGRRAGDEGKEYDEPVFNRAGEPRGFVRVKRPVGAYWCHACREPSPCVEQKTIARALGIKATDT